MKRRVFVKNLGAASALAVLGPDAFSRSLIKKENIPVLLSDYSLTDFDQRCGKQDE